MKLLIFLIAIVTSLETETKDHLVLFEIIGLYSPNQRFVHCRSQTSGKAYENLLM